MFHLIGEHDGSSCLEMVCFSQMISKGETILEADEGGSQSMPSDSKIHYMEYVSDSERGGNMLVTLEDSSYVVLTRTQQNLKPQDVVTPIHSTAKGKEILNHPRSVSKVVQEVASSSFDSSNSSFDIIEFFKSSRIQISPAEYLKLNPKELDRLVEFVKGNDM